MFNLFETTADKFKRERSDLEAAIASGQSQINTLALDAETDPKARKTLDAAHVTISHASRRLAEINAAEAENARRWALAKQEAVLAAKRKARKEADRLIAARVKAAQAVDDAISALAVSLEAYRASLPPLIEQLAIAEGVDQARDLKGTLDRRLRQTVRLALWHGAPDFAELVHVERDSSVHRAPLSRQAEMLPHPGSDLET